LIDYILFENVEILNFDNLVFKCCYDVR